MNLKKCDCGFTPMLQDGQTSVTCPRCKKTHRFSTAFKCGACGAELPKGDTGSNDYGVTSLCPACRAEAKAEHDGERAYERQSSVKE